MSRTPGDWKFDPFAQGFIVVERPEDGRYLYLAEIVDEDDEGLFEPDEEKRLANGRLMAAAPELLAKMQKILGGNHEMSSVRGRGVAITGLSHEFIDEARALLSRIEHGDT